MVLFYGSKEIVVYPGIKKSIYNRNFYFGFYCTANKEQAERWAVRYEKKGYVNKYNYIPNPALDTLTFRGSEAVYRNKNLYRKKAYNYKYIIGILEVR